LVPQPFLKSDFHFPRSLFGFTSYLLTADSGVANRQSQATSF
jgi:hypothetical protein